MPDHSVHGEKAYLSKETLVKSNPSETAKAELAVRTPVAASAIQPEVVSDPNV